MSRKDLLEGQFHHWLLLMKIGSRALLNVLGLFLRHESNGASGCSRQKFFTKQFYILYDVRFDEEMFQ